MGAYTVISGDTLYAIANAHSVSLDSLIAINPQLNGSTNLEVGQVLHLPEDDSNSNSQPGNSDIEEALSIQNVAREEASKHGHSRGNLSWDDDLARDAQQWANYLAENGVFKHSGTHGQGENLYAATGDGATFAAAAHGWCNERKNYNGEHIGQGNFGSYGHYTQVVWPSTSKVGMASAKGHNGWTYVVGRYQAQGNYVGQSAW